MICQKFKPQLIIWDGQPNERGTREEYAVCIPDELWKKTIPISADDESQSWAQSKGAYPVVALPKESRNAWAAQLCVSTKAILIPVKAQKRPA